MDHCTHCPPILLCPAEIFFKKRIDRLLLVRYCYWKVEHIYHRRTEEHSIPFKWFQRQILWHKDHYHWCTKITITVQWTQHALYYSGFPLLTHNAHSLLVKAGSQGKLNFLVLKHCLKILVFKSRSSFKTYFNLVKSKYFSTLWIFNKSYFLLFHINISNKTYFLEFF